MKLEALDRPHDPRLADFRDVVDPRWLREQKVFLAEGRRLVAALLRAPGFRVRCALVEDGAWPRMEPELSDLDDGTPVYQVSRALMIELCGVRFHQGCVAAGERSAPPPSLGEWLAAAGERSRVVVLEGVSDPDNVGGIFRSARAFGSELVLLSPGSASPLSRKALRTPMGAALVLPFAELENWPRDLERLRAAGFRLLGLAPEPAALGIARLAAEQPAAARMALVLGAEGFGLSGELREQLDAVVRIPMAEGVDSLNVAAAAAVAMHRLFAPESG